MWTEGRCRCFATQCMGLSGSYLLYNCPTCCCIGSGEQQAIAQTTDNHFKYSTFMIPAPVVNGGRTCRGRQSSICELRCVGRPPNSPLAVDAQLPMAPASHSRHTCIVCLKKMMSNTRQDMDYTRHDYRYPSLQRYRHWPTVVRRTLDRIQM